MAFLLAKNDKAKRIVDHSYLPFSDRYVNGRRRYFFREWDPSVDSMFAYYTECPASSSQNSGGSDGPSAKIRRVEHSDGDNKISTGRFPVVVLDAIFAKLHPVDLVNSASMVCKSWNRMAFNPRFWKDAVITLSESNRSDRHRGARDFLHKMSGSLERLAIVVLYPTQRSFCVTAILPDKMPKMTHLQIEYRQRDGLVDGVCSAMHLPAEFRIIDKCMPQLRCLVLLNCLITSCCAATNWTEQPVDLQLLNGRRKAFARLESFQFLNCRRVSGESTYVVSVEEFCKERQGLEQIRIDKAEWKLNRWTPIRIVFPNLTRFSTRSCLSQTGVQQISSLKNLVFLDLSRWKYSSHELRPIGSLHHLEHLHLAILHMEENVPARAAFHDLFRASSAPSHFPFSVKYLRLNFSSVLDAVSCVDCVIASCPNLRMLGVLPCGLNLAGIDKCFRSLRHLVGLHVTSFEDLITAMEREKLPKRLRYIRVPEKDDIIRANAKMLSRIISLLENFPNTIVELDDNKIVTYRREGKHIMLMPELGGWKAKNAVALIQGSCCMAENVNRDEDYEWP